MKGDTPLNPRANWQIVVFDIHSRETGGSRGVPLAHSHTDGSSPAMVDVGVLIMTELLLGFGGWKTRLPQYNVGGSEGGMVRVLRHLTLGYGIIIQIGFARLEVYWDLGGWKSLTPHIHISRSSMMYGVHMGNPLAFLLVLTCFGGVRIIPAAFSK